MRHTGLIDDRYFCMSPLYMPSDWHIPAWFAKIRNGPPLGPCSSLDRIAEQTSRYVASHPVPEERNRNGYGSDFVGPMRKERRRVSRP